MAVITLARELYAAELAGVTNDTLKAWLTSWAEPLTRAPEWAPDLIAARSHLLGHVGERQAQAGTAGPVTAASSSTLSESYGSAAGVGAYQPGDPIEADLMQTRGGRAFLALVRSRVAFNLPIVG